MGGQNAKGIAARKSMCKSAIAGAENVDDLEEKMHAAFKAWDTDKSGTISLKELSAAVEKLGLKMSKGDLDKLLKESDTNKDGMISYEEFVSWLYAAPHLPNYFKIQQKIQQKGSKEAVALTKQMVSASADGLDMAKMQKVGAKMQALQTKIQNDLEKQLTPVIKKSFAWHDKNNSGVLEKDESIIFFSNYVELLTQNSEASMELSLNQQVNFGGVESKEMLSQMKANMKETLKQKREAYDKNAKERQHQAFTVIDVNKDGKLQEAEVIAALIPGTPQNLEFMKALDLIMDPTQALEVKTGMGDPCQQM